jgi:hypothetical protein
VDDREFAESKRKNRDRSGNYDLNGKSGHTIIDFLCLSYHRKKGQTMLNEQEFLKKYLNKQGEIRVTCGCRVYPGQNVLHYGDNYFCSEEHLGEWLIYHCHNDFTNETVPHIRKSTESIDA